MRNAVRVQVQIALASQRALITAMTTALHYAFITDGLP